MTVVHLILDEQNGGENVTAERVELVKPAEIRTAITNYVNITEANPELK